MTRQKLAISHDSQVLVTGSLAFDQIMVFPGSFKDHILPERLDFINISFATTEIRRQRGGCAGNIAYTLALLGDSSRIIAAAGNDFADYRAWLQQHGVDVDAIELYDDVATAACLVTADQSDNQITGFFPGAMERAGELSLKERVGERPGVVVVAPDEPRAMVRHCKEAREIGLPFIFDPSFQVTAMEGELLRESARGAAMLVVNDYEFAVFSKKTGSEGGKIFELVDVAVVTLGPEGSKILRSGAPELHIPAAPIAALVEPTGAGDAYRSGLIAGLRRGFDLEVCGRMGSVASAFVVEQAGPQTHAYSAQDFAERYAASFGPLPGDLE